MDYMTRVPGYPSSNQAKYGMAYFSDTGPFGTYCSKCTFYGPHGRGGRCAKYFEMVKSWGALIRKRQPSCKYYQEKPKPLPQAERK